MGPQSGPGSESSKGSARFQRAGSEGGGIALSGDEFVIPLREMKTTQPGNRRWAAFILALTGAIPRQRQRYYITSFEPARSVGGTGGPPGAKPRRGLEPGRRRRLNPLAVESTVCQTSDICLLSSIFCQSDVDRAPFPVYNMTCSQFYRRNCI
ncbi:hypothetical protein HMPREF9453_01242 [Dialister succinatiphilus YIT 11850]|uniref:Uncharacterized protein n=1 Tax=Dialister succinatiphilus YIT 11850 TaxID=742743 RepID=H1D0V4_9FIRM|nr:hypothetical protein HMPREF9453_01242 [Dialister succinatiphilus YIT 11850]